jgi:hypothetical protein
MNCLKEVKEELEYIFHKYSKEEGLVSEIARRGFVLSDISPKKILFVGLNPFYYLNSTPGNYILKPDEEKKWHKRYFGNFKDLAVKCNFEQDWSYMDLLYFRETDQFDLENLLSSSVGEKFICEQLQVSIKILEELKPKVIIVCKDEAREFLGIDKKINKDGQISDLWMGYEFLFAENLGVDVISHLHEKSIKKGVKTTRLGGTRVVFASTLTFHESSNKNRLEWQIKHILNYQYPPEIKLENYPGSPEKLIQIVQKLSERVEKLKQSKIKAVDDKIFEWAANFWEEERIVMTKIMKLLMIAEKEISEFNQ